jgi:tRNA G46 methylase TrmB
MSSQILAQRFPDHLVVGIDKSSARLARALPRTPPNCLLIHGDVIDLWRLIKGEELPVRRHYLLFPNPWPKADQVKRRFHAHPVFETMVSLAPYFELRTNWLLYAKELVNALTLLGQKPTIERKVDDDFMTLFEKKYQESSCPVYMVQNRLMAFPEQEQLSNVIPDYG